MLWEQLCEYLRRGRRPLRRRPPGGSEATSSSSYKVRSRRQASNSCSFACLCKAVHRLTARVAWSVVAGTSLRVSGRANSRGSTALATGITSAVVTAAGALAWARSCRFVCFPDRVVLAEKIENGGTSVLALYVA